MRGSQIFVWVLVAASLNMLSACASFEPVASQEAQAPIIKEPEQFMFCSKDEIFITSELKTICEGYASVQRLSLLRHAECVAVNWNYENCSFSNSDLSRSASNLLDSANTLQGEQLLEFEQVFTAFWLENAIERSLSKQEVDCQATAIEIDDCYQTETLHDYLIFGIRQSDEELIKPLFIGSGFGEAPKF